MLISEFLNYFVTTVIRVRRRLAPLQPIWVCRRFGHDIFTNLQSTAVSFKELRPAFLYGTAMPNALCTSGAEFYCPRVTVTVDHFTGYARRGDPDALAKVTE